MTEFASSCTSHLACHGARLWLITSCAAGARNLVYTEQTYGSKGSRQVTFSAGLEFDVWLISVLMLNYRGVQCCVKLRKAPEPQIETVRLKQSSTIILVRHSLGLGHTIFRQLGDSLMTWGRDQVLAILQPRMPACQWLLHWAGWHQQPVQSPTVD